MNSSYDVLEKIINNAPSSMFAMDRQHCFLLTNPVNLQCLGLTEEQVIGHTELECFSQESAAKLWADNEYIMSTDRQLQREEEILLKNGQHITVTTVKFPFHDNNGKVIGLCGISTDISPLHQAEDLLRANELTYRALFDNMLNGLAYCRMVFNQDQPVDFVYIKVNKTFETLTGLHHVIGRKASDVSPGICEHDQQVLELYGRVALTGRSERLELFVNALHNWFSLSVYSPQAGYFVVVFDVITEKKTAELALKESEIRLRLALDAAKLGVYEWNLSTNRLIWPQRTQELFGYRPGEFSGNFTDFSSRVHPEDLATVEAEIARSQIEGNRYYCEYRIIWPDGSVHWITAIGEFGYDSEGQPLIFRGIVEDNTEKKRTEQKLREAEELWVSAHYTRNLIETSLDPLLTISSDGKITDVNTATEAATGCSRDHLIASNFSDYFTDPMAAINIYQQVFLSGSVRNYALKIRHRDGHLTPILFNATVYRNDAGEIAGIFAAARDITEIELIQQALKISEALFRCIFNESPLGIALIDSFTGQIYEVNPMFAKIAGRSSVEMMNIDWMSITHPDDVQEDLDNMALLNAGKISRFTMEKRYLHLDGTSVWINMTIAPIVVEDKAHPRHLCMIEDISERKIIENKINQLAFYDPLTQLPNRRLLLERIEHSIHMEKRERKQFALMMLDLDFFKEVNDNLGHLAGDELLQQVAARITARLRDIDTVARQGGDEFIVLLEGIVLPEDAARVAKEIIADLSQPFQLSQSDSVQIGVSIGISLYPQHGDNPDTLIDHADQALYQAKDAGRGYFAYFSEDMTLAAKKHIELEIRLRHAIEKNELLVFYQPQMNVVSDKIVGAEALVRWKDPENGLIQPIGFIPLAEESNLIVEIDNWVLNETCRQGRVWLDLGLLSSLTLAVNLSPHQFYRHDICALVMAVLEKTNFPANQLELEITESGLLDQHNAATAIFNSLRAMGVGLAIDDFGTGYSSLSYLKRFSLNVLKIDKSFIDDIPFSQDGMKIADTIIAIAHILGFKVLAEGVETPEQLAFLNEKGCDMYQGYIKSQAITAAAFAELLRKQQN